MQHIIFIQNTDIHKDFILLFSYFGLWNYNFDHFVILILGKHTYLHTADTKVKQNVNSLGW